jgi:hypothetical protein
MPSRFVLSLASNSSLSISLYYYYYPFSLLSCVVVVVVGSYVREQIFGCIRRVGMNVLVCARLLRLWVSVDVHAASPFLLFVVVD